MNHLNLDILKENLLKEREEIILMLEDLEEETRESISEPVSASDEIADKYELKQEVHVQREVLEERLKKIDEALTRMKEGTYGICYQCHQPIEEVRLKIDPATHLCRNCALRIT
jgi:DnaK suppressor protein